MKFLYSIIGHTNIVILFYNMSTDMSTIDIYLTISVIYLTILVIHLTILFITLIILVGS